MCIGSVQFNRSVVSDSLRLHELQNARPPCPLATPGVHSDSCPLSQWCHPTISSSVIPFSSCLQSFPASGSLPMSQLFAWVWGVIRRRQWHPTPVLLPGKSHGQRSLVGPVHGVAKSRAWLSDFTFTFPFHALEKEMATHSRTLPWRIPGTGKPGGLPSMGSHRVGHDWSDLAAARGVIKDLVWPVSWTTRKCKKEEGLNLRKFVVHGTLVSKHGWMSLEDFWTVEWCYPICIFQKSISEDRYRVWWGTGRFIRKRVESSYSCIILVIWVELCLAWNQYIEALTPSLMVFGDGPLGGN